MTVRKDVNVEAFIAPEINSRDAGVPRSKACEIAPIPIWGDVSLRFPKTALKGSEGYQPCRMPTSLKSYPAIRASSVGVPFPEGNSRMVNPLRKNP